MNNLSTKLLKELSISASNGKNLVFSPTSIYYTLGQLALGAKCSTYNELMK